MVWEKTAALVPFTVAQVTARWPPSTLSRTGEGAERPPLRLRWPGSRPVASPARAQERAIPFWPDAVPAAIHAEVDGVADARDRARARRASTASRARRASPPRPSMMRQKAARRRPLRRRDRALPRRRKDEVRALPLATTAGRRSPPRSRRSRRRASLIAAFPDLPVALADYSQDADVTARARRRRRGHVAEGLRGQGRARQDRARRRDAADRPPPRLRGARRRGLPLRLPEPVDALVRRRPRPRPLGTPLSLPAPEPLRVHGLEAPGRGAAARGSPPARRSCSARARRTRRWSRRPTTSSSRRSRERTRRRARSS